MTLATLAIVLAAAFIHALWNLIVVAARDRTATTTIVILFGALVFMPIAVARWNVQPEAWPYIALSSVPWSSSISRCSSPPMSAPT